MLGCICHNKSKPQVAATPSTWAPEHTWDTLELNLQLIVKMLPEAGPALAWAQECENEGPVAIEQEILLGCQRCAT